MCVCLRESVRLECGSPLPPVCVCVRRPGGVFDRLSTPHNFTGVYRRAWLSDGRINHFADTGVSSIPTAYEGDTNTRTDEHIADISVCVRPPPPFPPRACVREPSCTHPVPCACESILTLRVGGRMCPRCPSSHKRARLRMDRALSPRLAASHHSLCVFACVC